MFNFEIHLFLVYADMVSFKYILSLHEKNISL